MMDSKLHKYNRLKIYNYLESQFGKLKDGQHKELKRILKEYQLEAVGVYIREIKRFNEVQKTARANRIKKMLRKKPSVS